MTSFVAGFVALTLAVAGIWGRGGVRRQWPWLLAVAVLVAVAVAASPDHLILQKTISRMALPLGALWLGLWALTAWRLGTGHRRGAMRSGVVAVVVTLVGNEPLGQSMMTWLEAPFANDPFAEAPFDAVIVLGGGAQAGPWGHPELGPAGDRILLGARLFRAGTARALVTTGTPIAGFQKPFDSTAATRTMWEEVGVPAEAIVVVHGARNTSEEAEEAARLVKARGWRRIGLVTSAWHLRRATGLFKRAGLDVVPLAADHRGDASWEGLFSMVPSGYGAWLQQKAVWELLGAAVGR